MYNDEIAKLDLGKVGPAKYLNNLNTELASAITMVRTGAEAGNLARIGEGVKRLNDCRVALETYISSTLPK